MFLQAHSNAGRRVGLIWSRFPGGEAGVKFRVSPSSRPLGLECPLPQETDSRTLLDSSFLSQKGQELTFLLMDFAGNSWSGSRSRGTGKPGLHLAKL